MSFDTHNAKTRPHLFTVSESIRGNPRIVLSGAWLGSWGFCSQQLLSTLYISPGVMMLKTGASSKQYYRSGQTVENQQPPAPHLFKKYRPHPVTVCESPGHKPKITISGAWLPDWCISIGDRVSVTRTQAGDLLIVVFLPASAWREIKKRKKLEQSVAIASAILTSHKTKFPDLSQQITIAAKRDIVPAAPSKVVQSSLFNQLMIATREYNMVLSARRATTPSPT